MNPSFSIFAEWLDFIFDNIQLVFNMIMGNWLLSVVLGLQVIYLIVVAVKLKRNTD